MNYHMIKEIREQPQAFARIVEGRGRIREVAEKVWTKSPTVTTTLLVADLRITPQ